MSKSFETTGKGGEWKRAVTTALVLSAGGMFGAYQAGVWRVLADLVQPDMVVGASIGSVNGWLIAGGCPPGELSQRWLTFDRGSHPEWRFPQRAGDGFINSDPVERWLREIYDSATPRVSYGAVATELRRMQPRLFRYPDFSWEHLLASCAVPLFLRQVRIGGLYYGDGGLLDPLPLWAAAEMGATRIITVNLLPRRPVMVRAAVRCARLYSRFRAPELSGAIEVLRIEPSERLGSAIETIYWTRANAERWMALGEKDANAAKHLVVKCFERV